MPVPTAPHNWYDICRTTRTIVRTAGEIILDHWNKPRNIRLKGRIDLVTETDVAVEKALKTNLEPLLEDAVFLAEETSGDAEYGEYTWIIDPVDGTTNFAHGLPFVAESVALLHNEETVLGVIYLPVLNEMFWAVRGQGAFCNEKRIAVTDTENLEQSLVATGFPYTIQEHADIATGMLNRVLKVSRGVRRCGAAAVDLAYTARGTFDAFYENDLKPWDTAAGILLVREAGGTVSAFDAAQAYVLGGESILAGNGKINGALSKLLIGG